jgi:phosphopantothenoylcysteine decarboxylase
MATTEPVQESLMPDYPQPRKPRVLLAASGSVAAIKFEILCRSFSEWAEVRAVVTKASLHFVDRSSLPKGIVLYTDDDEWSTWKKIGDEVLHIELRKWADIMVIAPLSANTLAKVCLFFGVVGELA